MNSQTINTKLIVCPPCSPSTVISGELKPMTKVEIHIPGGMSGGTRNHYGSIESQDDKMIHFSDEINNKKVTLSKNFLISMEDVGVYVQKVDTTAHANYRERICAKREVARYFEQPSLCDFKILNEYSSVGESSKAKPFLTVVHEE